MRKPFIVFILMFLVVFSSLADSLPVLKSQNDVVALAKKYSGLTMVVFWAPWCPHCMREMRMLRDNPAYLKQHKLQVIGMVKENDASSAASTAKDEKFPFKIYAGTRDLYNDMQKIDAVPYTVVFNNKGVKVDDEYGEQKLEELTLLLK